MSQLTEGKKMVSGWRRVFCTSIPTDYDSTAIEELDEYDQGLSNSSIATPKYGSRLGFFFSSSSNPSSPRLRSRTTASPSPSARLSPEIITSPRLLHRSLNTSTPCSPSSFSFLKSSLRLRTRRCGLCLQSMKNGKRMASFTAECSHTFHFPCISDHVQTQGSLACPVCSSLWKEMPLLTVDDRNQENRRCNEENSREKLATRFMEDVVDVNEYLKLQHKRPDLKVYNDDEPLAVLTPKARFNPIPESDENFDEDFCINGGGSSQVDDHGRDVEVRLSPEAAVIAASRRYETYAIVLKVRAPAAPEKIQQRAPVDLVAVVDVSGKITGDKLKMMKKAMRSIVSSLSSSDRLSIVAFSSHSKRLLPLRRMTTSGRRAVRCILEAMAGVEGSPNSKDAVKKAVKVLLDRREKNSVAAVILLSDDVRQSSCVSSIRYSHSRLNIPVHSLKIAGIEEHVFTKYIGKLLTVVVQDLRLQIGFVPGNAPAVIEAVYLRTPQPIVLGSSTVEIGELSSNEERELLVEIKLPSSAVRSHQVLSVRCQYLESWSQEIIYGQQQTLLVPQPTTVRSSSPTIQRLRNLFISTRALAESRRLTENNDLASACDILVSARALMQQSNSAPDNEFILGLEVELSELQRRREVQAQAQQLGRRCRVEMAPVAYTYTDEKGEPLTPISAWRVADKLAKAAMMRKSANRVSDLHGFEDARF